VSTADSAHGAVNDQSIGWSKHAEPLADWTLSRVVVRQDVYGVYSRDGKGRTEHEPPTREILIRHFRGEITIALHSTSTQNECKAFTLDVDAHDASADLDLNWGCVELAVEVLRKLDLYALICDSNGKGGYHVRVFFKKPVPSAAAFWLGELVNCRLKAAGLPEVEFFPKQAELTIATPYGNLVRVPGKHPKRDHWTRIYDPSSGKWLEGEEAALALIRVAGDSPAKLLEAFREETVSTSGGSGSKARVNPSTNGKLDPPDEATVKDALAHYPNADLSYDEWLAVGMCLNDWDPEAGRPMFLEWSRQSTKHDDATTKAKWDSFSPGGGLTIATLFKAAMDNGWSPPPTPNGRVKSKNGSKKKPGGQSAAAAAAGTVPYAEHDGCTFSASHDRKGNPIETKIAGFTARITTETTRHEAGEITKHFEIKATHADGSTAMVTIKATDFEAMAWVPAELGSKFSIEPGRGTRDQVRHAVQLLSHRDGVQFREVYTALGWHDIDGRWVYLHAGGGIDADGPVAVHVETAKEVAIYRLPEPDEMRFAQAVEHVLMVYDLLGDQAVAAVFASLPCRAVLGPSRQAVHFSGSTGSCKTSLACLITRFHAPGFERTDPMPATWKSTANAIQRAQHEAGDVVLPVDNLVADGEDVAREQFKADTVFDCQGDLGGRRRMRPDGTLALALDPRTTLLSTGEIDPRRKLALGRSLVVELKPGMFAEATLDQCHAVARAGHLAQAMACYAQHLAAPGKLDAQRQALRQQATREQAKALKHCPDCHGRHAEAVGELAAAWSLFLDFAVDQGAITRGGADRYVDEVRDSLFGLLSAQAAIQHESDAGEMFLDLLRSLLAAKRAVLFRTNGELPGKDNVRACGFEQVSIGDRTDWRPAPGAERIGWIDDQHVYIDPSIAHAAAARLARETRQVLGTQRQVLARLAETGRLVLDQQAAGDRRRFTRKITIEKSRRHVTEMHCDEVLALELATQ
jgi:hypothetical protein